MIEDQDHGTNTEPSGIDTEPYCGDGELYAGEECDDDNNNIDGDGCDATCIIEEQSFDIPLDDLFASPSEEPIQDEPVEEKELPLESSSEDLTGQAIIEEEPVVEEELIIEKPVVEEQPVSGSAQLDL